MSFAILREQEGFRHWVRKISPSVESEITARRPPPVHLLYADREAAECDAEDLRARDAEVAKSKRKVFGQQYKAASATYSVVPIE
jgi:hypothetical protein